MDLMPEVMAAIREQKEDGNKVVNFSDVIFCREVVPIIEDCRKAGFNEITISSDQTGYPKMLMEFYNQGCSVKGVRMVNRHYFNGDVEVPAVVISID